jgi:hypothetical protein
MTVDPGRLLNTEEIKLLQTDPSVGQNSQNQLYFNPVAMSAFDSTVVTPSLFVGFEELSAKEIIVHHVDTAVPGSTVRLRRAKNKRTGSCSFGPVIASTPFLRVARGRQNRYPYRIDDLEDGTQRFVLLLDKPKVVPVPTRVRKAAATRKRKAAGTSPAVALMGAGTDKEI